MNETFVTLKGLDVCLYGTRDDLYELPTSIHIIAFGV